MNYGRQILSNVGALALARGVTAILTLLTYAYLTRTLGPEAFGILSWGLAWLAYFSVGLDMGTSAYGVREISRAPTRVPELVGRILSARLLLLAGAIVLFYGGLLLLDKPSSFKAVVAVQGIALLGYAGTLEWVFQGIQRMGILAVRNIAASVMSFGAILLLVRDPGDAVWAAAASSFALVTVALALGVPYVRRWGTIRIRTHHRSWAPILRASLPIGASLFVMTIYGVTDQFLLGLMRSEAEVGWYGAAYRLLTASLIAGDVLNQAFLPALSHALGDRPLMRQRGRDYAAALFTIGLPVATAGLLLADELAVAFAGAAFAPASPALALLMCAAAMTYVGKSYGDALIAWNRERAYLAVVAAGAGANVVLTVVLIPPYGIVGAAAATAIAAGLITLAQAALYRRVLGTLHLDVLWRAATATLLGVGLPLLIGERFGWPLPTQLAVCAGAFAAAAVGLGLVHSLSFSRSSTTK